jgi:hypothetical protein
MGKKLLLMLWVKKHVYKFFCFVGDGKGPVMRKVANICVCTWESVSHCKISSVMTEIVPTRKIACCSSSSCVGVPFVKFNNDSCCQSFQPTSRFSSEIQKLKKCKNHQCFQAELLVIAAGCTFPVSLDLDIARMHEL